MFSFTAKRASCNQIWYVQMKAPTTKSNIPEDLYPQTQSNFPADLYPQTE
jgi:hypothetical protein